MSKIRFHILPKSFYEKLNDGTQRVIVAIDHAVKKELSEAQERDVLHEFEVLCLETNAKYSENDKQPSIEDALKRLTGRYMILVPVDVVTDLPGLHKDGAIVTVAVADRVAEGAIEIINYAQKKRSEAQLLQKVAESVSGKAKKRTKGKKKQIEKSEVQTDPVPF